MGRSYGRQVQELLQRVRTILANLMQYSLHLMIYKHTKVLFNEPVS